MRLCRLRGPNDTSLYRNWELISKNICQIYACIFKEGKQITQRQVIDNVGVIIISENRAAKVADVAAMTEYGNYCYHFDATDNVAALMRSADDYLMDRFLSGHDEHHVLDGKETVRNMERRLVMEDKQRKELLNCMTDMEAFSWAGRWDVSERVVREALVHRYGRQARLFAARVLPAIRESAKQFAMMREGMID